MLSFKRLVLFLIGGSFCLMPLLVVLSTGQAHGAESCSSGTRLDCSADPPVVALGQRYMEALLEHDYETMWSMLHPDLQATWRNESTFATYWETRFHDFTLQGYTLGKASKLSFWVNPETMVRYDQVEMLPISLQLVPQEPLDPFQQASTPYQQASHLFQNLPFIVQPVTTEEQITGGDPWRILSGGPADLEAPILPPPNPVSRTITVPILMYHYISDPPTHDPNPTLRRSLSVSPVVFKQQMDYLTSHNYHTITLNQLFDALYYDGPLPSRPIILTFDDGYEDAYTNAYPILQAHGYSGMFYIITGKVGWQGQMNWSQLHEMLNNGMQVGSHTVHHVDIGQMWLHSPAQADQEVSLSQMDLQNHLGISIQQFCYPFGEPFHHGSRALQQAILALLAEHGYVGATTDPPPLGNTQNGLNPLMLLRTRVDGRESLQAFIKSLSDGYLTLDKFASSSSE